MHFHRAFQPDREKVLDLVKVLIPTIGLGRTDKAVKWMNERYDKVKEYYKPFENEQLVHVGVFMGLIFPEAKMGFREGWRSRRLKRIKFDRHCVGG